MTLEHAFSLTLPGTVEDLLKPEAVFAGRGPFGKLVRHGEELHGTLVAEAPLIGEIEMPFRSRLVQLGENRAQLEALAGESPLSFWAELWGQGEAKQGQLHYRLNLRIHAQLPAGDKWGGQALRKMAEAAFERQIDKALRELELG
jgi:hypothetical protein